MLFILLKGLIIGFAIAAPVGPIGVLCIQHSLQDGFKVGLMTGIGAAFADGIYGLIAGFGLTSVSNLLIAHQFWIRIIGGSFLLYMGIKLILSLPQKQSNKYKPDRSPLHACGTTFLLTLTNPATILSFIAIFAGLGLGTINPDYAQAIILVLGITLGSAFWWILLSGGVAFILRRKVNSLLLRIIQRLSGTTIIAFGIFALIILH
jgi:threonine/homoserine/homoserine lactone efflux protein